LAARPVNVIVSTVVVRSATFTRRTVALRTPILKARSAMMRSPENRSGVTSSTRASTAASRTTPISISIERERYRVRAGRAPAIRPPSAAPIKNAAEV
jgi:hypothetical protein